MSKVKFEAARELIQEKHYDAARAILHTIDHDKARDWLAKLDAIDLAPYSGEGSEEVDFPPVTDAAQGPSGVNGETGLAVIVILMAVVVAVSYFVLPWAKGARLTANHAYQLGRTISCLSSEDGGSVDLDSMVLIPIAAAWAGVTGFLSLTRAVPGRGVLWSLCALVCVAGMYPYGRLLLFNGQELSRTISNMESGAVLGAGAMSALFCLSTAGVVDAMETRAFRRVLG